MCEINLLCLEGGSVVETGKLAVVAFARQANVLEVAYVAGAVLVIEITADWSDRTSAISCSR